MRIFIKHRNEGQARKILDEEHAEEYFQRLVEFGDPDIDLLDDVDEPPIYSIEEADEIFDWISGQYEPVDDHDFDD